LTGILVPTGGQVHVGGLDPSRERVELARRIGVVFGQRSTLWWDLPLRDSFDLLQKMYRIPPARYRENLDRFVDLVDEAPPIAVPGATVRKVEGPRQWLSFPSDASAAPIVAAVASAYDVADLSIQEPDIEDVIRDLYARGT
jgi:ABC-type uncharacterized transport system ATPase subunit